MAAASLSLLHCQVLNAAFSLAGRTRQTRTDGQTGHTLLLLHCFCTPASSAFTAAPPHTCLLLTLPPPAPAYTTTSLATPALHTTTFSTTLHFLLFSVSLCGIPLHHTPLLYWRQTGVLHLLYCSYTHTTLHHSPVKNLCL